MPFPLLSFHFFYLEGPVHTWNSVPRMSELAEGLLLAVDYRDKIRDGSLRWQSIANACLRRPERPRSSFFFLTSRAEPESAMKMFASLMQS